MSNIAMYQVVDNLMPEKILFFLCEVDNTCPGYTHLPLGFKNLIWSELRAPDAPKYIKWFGSQAEGNALLNATRIGHVESIAFLDRDVLEANLESFKGAPKGKRLGPGGS